MVRYSKISKEVRFYMEEMKIAELHKFNEIIQNGVVD
jgi:hypothetical protein